MNSNGWKWKKNPNPLLTNAHMAWEKVKVNTGTKPQNTRREKKKQWLAMWWVENGMGFEMKKSSGESSSSLGKQMWTWWISDSLPSSQQTKQVGLVCFFQEVRAEMEQPITFPTGPSRILSHLILDQNRTVQLTPKNHQVLLLQPRPGKGKTNFLAKLTKNQTSQANTQTTQYAGHLASEA